MAERDFDIVIFGATGVTGKHVVEQLYLLSKTENLKWAVAGRNKEKLRAALKEVSSWCNLPDDFLVQVVPVIICDVGDYQSLLDMARRARVVLNTVGPYRFFGEPVVKACVEASTHHFDVSGEPQYMESMQLKYFEEAKKKGIYIVSACGFDSIPCELVFHYLKTHIGGDLNGVETFVSFHPGPQGFKTNTGTWRSAIYGLAHWNELTALRREARDKLFTKPLPSPKYKLPKRSVVFPSPVGNSGWCVPFLGSDRSVVIHSEMFRYLIDNDRPAQIQTYLRLPSFLIMLGIGFIAGIFGALTKCRIGRWLLNKYPEFFSFGMFREGGPTREQTLGASFSVWALGEGWSDKLSDPTDQHSEPPSKRVLIKFHAPDPAYIFTSRCLLYCGVTCLRESDKMLGSGGVLSPGAAFGKTSLFERLIASDDISLIVESAN